MNDIRSALLELQKNGWTSAAIADELGVSPITIFRWQKGMRDPDNLKSVLYLLESLLKRKRVPKRRRRGSGSHYRNTSDSDIS